MTQKLLAGQTALITGASSGLGAHFAEVMARQGAHLVLTARREQRLIDLKEQLQQYGTNILINKFDVKNIDAIPKLFDSIETAGHRVDILVNNAGINIEKATRDITYEDYQNLMDTNLTAPFFIAQAAAQRMVEHKIKGRIINIASVCAQHALRGLTLYCMSKAAIHMMSRGMAQDFARHGINVNSICPGFIETEINDQALASEGGQMLMKSWPRARVTRREDLDGALLLFASPAGERITGTSITVDDGQYI